MAAEIDREGGLSLTVADTGIGIAADQLERVLQPFTQVENTLTRTHAGTGLGLPLCKSLIELHGGRLVLESVVGRGTRRDDHAAEGAHPGGGPGCLRGLIAGHPARS